MSEDSAPRVTTETRDHVFLIGLSRPAKLNAFDLAMLRELADAYTVFEDDPAMRCAVLYAHGDNFTSGLDLAEVGPVVAEGQPLFPENRVDPLGLYGRKRTKPVVIAVQGWCLTIGIELMLASDIRIAARDTRFGQIEIQRGIFPFGGATIRWPALTGWGNAMRYLLTGDRLEAEEAYRIGLVQEVVDTGEQFEAAVSMAQRVAAQAPLGVQATVENARIALNDGPDAAIAQLHQQAIALFDTEDANEGVRSFVERRQAQFVGR